MSAILKRGDLWLGLSALAIGTLQFKFVSAREKTVRNRTSREQLWCLQGIAAPGGQP
jgi:hypothetical protein